MLTETMLYTPLRRLARLVRSRQVSPVELAELALARLERYGQQLGAVVTLTAELALSQARTAEAEIARGHYRGPLHGIPYGAKDLLATAGIPTTWGAAPLRQQMFDFDATVIRKLQAAGAVLVAKLAMVELAGGMGYNNADASFTGPGRTPWNLDYWSGGSSSGSGAAVAAGLVPFAIGSETSGSILTPAAFCGVSGLRPTYGRVSRHGAMALSWTLDKLGPLCRSADDCGLVLAAIAGPDPADPTTIQQGFAWQRPARLVGRRGGKPRIGVIAGATEKALPAVRQNFAASLEVLAEFADLEREVPFPDFPYGPVVSTILQAEAAAAFRDLIESGRVLELTVPRDRTGGYAFMMTLAVDYLQAMRLRVPVQKALATLFETYDALVCPTNPSLAYPIGVDFEKARPDVGGGPNVIPATNLAGLPALAVPNGFGEHNLPTSLQLLGPALGERTLLALGHAYQQATGWHMQQPPAFSAERQGIKAIC